MLEVIKDVLPSMSMSTRLAWIERATVSSILRPPPPLLLLLLLTWVAKEEEEVNEEDPFPDEEKDLMALPPLPPPLLFRAIFHFSLWAFLPLSLFLFFSSASSAAVEINERGVNIVFFVGIL